MAKAFTEFHNKDDTKMSGETRNQRGCGSRLFALSRGGEYLQELDI